MHYYSFHLGDYIRATVHLTNEEDLAYRRLMDFYYETEKEIPLETQWVSRRLRVGIESVEFVLGEFFSKTETGYFNARCDAEIRHYHSNVEKNRINGKAGGRPKKTQSVSNGNPVETQSKPDGKATNNHKPITNKDIEPDVFNFKNAVIDLGVTESVANDWMKVRKVKKCANTETALNKIVKELEKTHLSPNEAIELCCAKSWGGFEAEWAKNSVSSSSNWRNELAFEGGI